jgi:signal transduction histidine kinase
MEQVLERLLSWAFRLSAPGGQVHVEARAQVGNVRVTISDASAGLSPRDQERIFELFFQPEGETERGAASGLGLAFVKELVERQGGQIRIETQPGNGNSFVFSVPATS